MASAAPSSSAPSSTAAVVPPPTVSHLAPAGSSYTSTENAGNVINSRYCGFPNTTKSFLLPKYLSTKFPELSIHTKDGNKSGERAEYIVHKKFSSLIRKPLAEPVLGFVSVNLDNDNGQSIKQKSLQTELPSLNLNTINMKREHDLIIMVKDLGFVVVEVKGSASSVNLQKAEEQLANSEDLVQCLWRAVTGSPSATLPSAKIIAIPEEKVPSPTTKTNFGSLSFYEDAMNNLQTEWEKVMVDLRNQVTTSVNSAHFQRLADLLTGFWTMKPLNRRSATYDESEASEAEQLIKIDQDIDTANIVSKIGKRTTDRYETKPTEIFQQTQDLKLLHLTPPQKDIFDNLPRVILRGHGGTGKTILSMLKMVETLQHNPQDNMVVVAPHPHHIRCHHFLTNNGISSQIITQFPFIESTTSQKLKRFFNLNQNNSAASNNPSTSSSSSTPPSTSNVFIMTLKDFFGVTRNTLLSYNLKGFHVIVDDLQGYEVEGTNCNYWDVADFIEQTHKMMDGTDRLLWVCLDAAQQTTLTPDEKEATTDLFTKRFLFTTVSRTFRIPVVSLLDVLRNSEEVTDVVRDARKKHVNELHLNKAHMLTDVNPGYEITCEVVVHHRLVSGTPKQQCEQFVCERMYEELHHLTTTAHQHFNMSDVAVLFRHDDDLRDYSPPITQMLLTKLNIHTQSIKQQITTNNVVDVVMDGRDNVNSFECAVVVMVMGGRAGRGVYNLCSRPRTKLLIINTNEWSLNYTFANTQLIEWRWNNNAFEIVP